MKNLIKQLCAVGLCWVAAGLLSSIWDWRLISMYVHWQFWVSFILFPVALAIAQGIKSGKQH